MAGGALLAAGLVVAAVFVEREVALRRELAAAHPVRSGTIAVRGLAEPVTVIRDARGIPHVRAASEEDALFALGFVHAQDRLAQMEWMRRAADGRTAAALGRVGLPIDRLARTVGFARLAARQAHRLDPDTRRALEAYAAGVNARLARIRAGAVALPAPLAKLGISPAPWTPADTIAVEKLWAFGLDGTMETTLLFSDLIQRLGAFEARLFFPPEAAGTLVPAPTGTPLQPGRSAAVRGALERLRASLGLRGRGVGSSAWIVAGSLSASGAPLLAADTHLEPTVPALLYEAQLAAPGFRVAGATIPGIPVFWTGHNRHVAWAATHARVSVTDLYVETLDPSDPSRYQDGSRWRKLTKRTETIRVRGTGPERLVVSASRHGPLVGKLLGRAGEPLALAWAGAQPGDGVGALLRAARAPDAEAFRAALATHDEPALVFVYVDAKGQGGRQLAGWIPKRAMPTGLVPVPGRPRWYDWRGRVPFDALPHATLGSNGRWLIAADNGLGDGEGADRIEWYWRTGERARRIDALLRAASRRGPLSLSTLVAMQGDVAVEGARKEVQRLLALAGPRDKLPEAAQEVARLLARWDGRAGAQSAGAAAYQLVTARLLRRLLAKPLGPRLLQRYLASPETNPETVLETILEQALHPDPTASPEEGASPLVSADAVRTAVRESLRETGLRLLTELGANREKWTWGRLHRLRFHAFGWPADAWIEPLGTGALPYGGDAVTVAAAVPAASGPPDVRVVSLYRFVADAGSLGVTLSSLAPGQSEHPGDPWRADEIDDWLADRPQVLATQPLLVEQTGRARLELEPKR